MRALEQNTGQEIQTLQKAMVKIFEKIEEIIKTDDQGEKVQGQDLASPVCARVWDDLPRVLAAYVVIFSEKPSGTKNTK